MSRIKEGDWVVRQPFKRSLSYWRNACSRAGCPTDSHYLVSDVSGNGIRLAGLGATLFDIYAFDKVQLPEALNLGDWL